MTTTARRAEAKVEATARPWADYGAALVTAADDGQPETNYKIIGDIANWGRHDISFVVRAVNCHDALIDACTQALAFFEDDEGVAQVIIAALAKATAR